MIKAKVLDELFAKFDKARADAKSAEIEKKELSDEIKARLEQEKVDEVETPAFECFYKFEKDKESEIFDEEKFIAKDPAGYKKYVETLEKITALTKKYTKTVVTKGARKLIVTRKNEAE